MASSSIESAAKWIGNLLIQEIQHLATVRDKVEELQSELEWMQCFLWDADEKQNKNALLRKWVTEIKDSALQAEDLVDLYVLGITHKSEKEGIWVLKDLKWLCCCWMEAKKLHNMGSDIDALTAKISKMTSRLQTYGVKSSYDRFTALAPVDKNLADQRRTYSHVLDKDVIGLDQCVNELSDQLRRGGQHMIVAVHGMGGIGKTTLAREVLHHGPLREQFVGFAWVYISQQLQLGPICREILLQLIPEKDNKARESVQGSPDSQLPEKLFHMLEEKKYLIVLDDIWFNRDWKSLEPAFPLTTCHGSKLLVTTRNRHIFSSLPNEVVSYYEVQVLDRNKSWQLLEKKANFQKEIEDAMKVALGDQMLHHCNGHPLAIAVLGGVLSTKKSVEEWESICYNLPGHLQGDETYSGVYELLAMSYHELPYNIKPCFLHFGHFPEDFEIPVEKLYHLWIAEGIVSSTQDRVAVCRSLDDVCEVYLNDLVLKSMVQVSERGSDGKIRTCRLHDLMRDKCLDINTEESYLEIIEYEHRSRSEQDHALQNRPIRENPRRMTVYFDQKLPSIPKSQSLRSLMFFPSADTDKEDCKIVLAICQDFPLLRVLDFESVGLQGRLPREIEYLIYLRYLSLKGTQIVELPSSIGNLRFLMILDLRVSMVKIKIPNLLWKMKFLRHLYFPFRILSQEYHHDQGYEIEENNLLKLDQLSHLEKLEDVGLDNVDVKGLIELTRMRRLSASCVSKKECLEPFLKSSSIKSLTLKIKANIVIKDPTILSACASLKVLHVDGPRIDRVYLPMNLDLFPQNLVELGFWCCMFSEDPMSILEKLPKLKNLELRVCYGGEQLTCSENGFPELNFLCIDGLFGLKKLTVKKGGLPKVTKVNIYNSPIEMLPDFIQSHVSIECDPCVRGIEKHGSCPFFNGW